MKKVCALFFLATFQTAMLQAEPEATKDKITRDEAQHIALKQVPDGSVKSARLERQGNAKFWAVAIARPGAKALSEIRVDSMSGRIITAEESMPPAEGPKKPKP